MAGVSSFTLLLLVLCGRTFCNYSPKRTRTYSDGHIRGWSSSQGLPPFVRWWFHSLWASFYERRWGDSHHFGTLCQGLRVSSEFLEIFHHFQPKSSDIGAGLKLSMGPQTYDKYLGLSSFIGKDKRRAFSGLKEKGQKKLKLWRSKVFSISGQEVLIKVVPQVTATYLISAFKIPTTLCNMLQALVAMFWWGGSKNCRKIH